MASRRFSDLENKVEEIAHRQAVIPQTVADVVFKEFEKYFSKKSGSGSGGGKANEIKKKAKEAGAAAEKSAKSFEKLRKSAGKAFAVLGGIGAITALFAGYLSASSALGRLSRNLGVNAQELKAWKNAVKAADGDVNAFEGTLNNLTSSARNIAANGTDPALQYFQMLGVSTQKASGGARKETDMLLDLADAFQRVSADQAYSWGSSMGIDDDTIALLLKGRGAVEGMVGAQHKFAVGASKDAATAKQLRAQIERLKSSAEKLAYTFLRSVMPYVQKGFNALEQFSVWVEKNGPTVKAFFISLGAVMAGVAIGIAASWMAALWPIILLLGAIFLLVDDFLMWNAGKKSLLGGLYESFSGIADKVKAAAAMVDKALASALSRALGIANDLLDALNNIGDSIYKNMPEFMQKGILRVLGATDEEIRIIQADLRGENVQQSASIRALPIYNAETGATEINYNYDIAMEITGNNSREIAIETVDEIRNLPHNTPRAVE